MNRKVALAIVSSLAIPLVAADKIDQRITESTTVLKTIVAKEGIPKSVLDRAACVLVYPGVRKVGVGIGVTYGRGVLSCHTGKDWNGPWSPPAMFSLDTGSLGAQLGSSSTDYVLLVMTDRGAEKVLSGKLKLGADASAVAGPNSAQASGFNDPNVDVASYSQAKGLFAGASLGSASMEGDDSANKTLYGKPVSTQQIVRDGAVTTPPGGAEFIALLNKTAPHRHR
ncbi:MAG TPA: lipid-binding SYLF domain-containing protein [Bryobacteraceae bacterium]|nr:lipid-binding SYLF domain-containing protein [Bryobacteraceae bacterium]